MIKSYKPEIAKLLEIQDYLGRTVLHFAVSKLSNLKLFIKHYFKQIMNLLEKQDRDGETVIHYAVFEPRSLDLLLKNYTDLVEDLLDIQDETGRTALSNATLEQDSLHILLKSYPNLTKKLLFTKDEDERVLLHQCAHRPEALKVLIYNCRKSVVEMLDMKDVFGRTALYYAIPHPDSLTILIGAYKEKICAMLSIQDHVDRTEVHYHLKHAISISILCCVYPQKMHEISTKQDTLGETIVSTALMYGYHKTSNFLKKINFVDGDPLMLECISRKIKNLKINLTTPPKISLNVFLDLNVYHFKDCTFDDYRSWYSSDNLYDTVQYVQNLVSKFDEDAEFICSNIYSTYHMSLLISKIGDSVTINYMDSGRNSMPLSLKLSLFCTLSNTKDSTVTIEDRTNIWQKYGSLSYEILRTLEEQLSRGVHCKLGKEGEKPKKYDFLKKWLMCIIPFSPKKVIVTEILDPKLTSQALHYLETGEIFDTMRHAIHERQAIIEMDTLRDVLRGLDRYNDSGEELELIIDSNESIDFALPPRDLLGDFSENP